MSTPTTTCPAWESFLAQAAPNPEVRAELQEFMGSALGSEPFDPEAFGFRRDHSISWHKRRLGEDGRPGPVVARLHGLPQDNLPTEFHLLLGSDSDTYYQGSIPTNTFAALLFVGMAASMDPEDDPDDLITVLLGNR